MKKYIALIIINLLFLIPSALIIYQIHFTEELDVILFSGQMKAIDVEQYKNEINKIDDIEYLRHKFKQVLNAYYSMNETLGADFEVLISMLYGLALLTTFNISGFIMFIYRKKKEGDR